GAAARRGPRRRHRRDPGCTRVPFAWPRRHGRRRRDKPERRDLVTPIGGTYAATSTTPLSEIAGNGVDLAFEATGSAEVAFAAMNILGRNGALILASVTGGHRSLTVPADDVNQRLVLGNVLVVGTVNANRRDF